MNWYVLIDLTRPHADVKFAIYRTVQAESRKAAIRKFQASEWAREVMGPSGTYKVAKFFDVYPNASNYDIVSADISTVSR